MKIGKLKCVNLKRIEVRIIYSEIINGKEYRYVEICGRGKLISRDGDAINPIRRCQPATIHYNADGYPCFGGGVSVYLYVATAWVDGWFEGAEVNHKDFDRTNYCADNLEWVTHKDNIDYTIENNYEAVCKSKQGLKNGRARFTVEQVLQIRKMYDAGSSVADIIKYFFPELQRVSQYRSIHSTVLNIAKRKTWKCIPEL